MMLFSGIPTTRPSSIFGRAEIIAGTVRNGQELYAGPEISIGLPAPDDHAALVVAYSVPKPDKSGRERDIRYDPQSAIADIDPFDCQIDALKLSELNNRNRYARGRGK